MASDLEIIIEYLQATHKMDRLRDEAEAWKAEQAEGERDETPEDWRDAKHDCGTREREENR